jgi:hypothetical protein
LKKFRFLLPGCFSDCLCRSACTGSALICEYFGVGMKKLKKKFGGKEKVVIFAARFGKNGNDH